MFKRWTLRDMLERERDLRIEAELKAAEVTAQVEALMVVASKQVGELELSPEEEAKLGEFFELGPGKDPGGGISEVGKG